MSFCDKILYFSLKILRFTINSLNCAALQKVCGYQYSLAVHEHGMEHIVVVLIFCILV